MKPIKAYDSYNYAKAEVYFRFFQFEQAMKYYIDSYFESIKKRKISIYVMFQIIEILIIQMQFQRAYSAILFVFEHFDICFNKQIVLDLMIIEILGYEMKILKAQKYVDQNIEPHLETIKEAYQGTIFLLNIDIRLYQLSILTADVIRAQKINRKIESFIDFCKDPIVKMKYRILNSYFHFYYKDAQTALKQIHYTSSFMRMIPMQSFEFNIFVYDIIHLKIKLNYYLIRFKDNHTINQTLKNILTQQIQTKQHKNECIPYIVLSINNLRSYWNLSISSRSSIWNSRTNLKSSS